MDNNNINHPLVETYDLINDAGEDYRLFISLPITYHKRSSSYPVLYVLDGNMFFGAAADISRMLSAAHVFLSDESPIYVDAPPELIVVGIGYPGGDPHALMKLAARRRAFDFTQLSEGLGPEGERLKIPLEQMLGESTPYGGASDFLTLLSGAIRSYVEQRYRVDTSKRILFGASAGGHFAAYALLSSPEAFTHYIIASPALYMCGEDLFLREAKLATDGVGLPAKVFLSMGSRELDLYSFSSIFSSTSRFSELLTMHRHEDLELNTCIFFEESHAGACAAAIGRGLNVLLTNDAEAA